MKRRRRARFFAGGFSFYVLTCIVAALIVGLTNPISGGSHPLLLPLVIGMVAIPVIFPFALALALLFAMWVPRHYLSWSIVFVLAVLIGVLGSWSFQSIRPFDFYHEADGSMPGWEPVRMYSQTTVKCCLIALVSVVGSAFACFLIARHNEPNAKA